MSEKPSFFDLPPLVDRPLSPNQKHPTDHPPLKFIFFSQSTDHGLALAAGFVILGGALTLFEGQIHQQLLQASALFWISAMATLFWISFLYRFFFILLMGCTPGNKLFRIRPSSSLHEPRFWWGQIFESLHLAFPALWPLEFFGRLLHFNLGVDYSFSSE